MGKKYKNTRAFPRVQGSDGMRKRFYAATLITQGFASNHKIKKSDISSIVKKSYDLADELLKQERIPKGTPSNKV